MSGSETVQSVDEMLRVYPRFLLGTPLGIGAIFGSIAMAVLTVVGSRIKWIWMGVIIYLTSLGVALDYSGKVVLNNLLPPFTQLRDLNRPLAILLLIFLTFRGLISAVGPRSKSISGAMLWLFLFEIYTSMALFFAWGGGVSRGIFGLLLFCLIFLSFGIGLSRWLDGAESAYSVFRIILGFGVMLLGGIAFHLIIRPSSMFDLGRLTGTTGNPQFLGAFLIFALPSCYCLLLKRDEAAPWRVAAGCCIGFSVVAILASGSRSAIIAGIVGVIVFFRRRLGQLLLSALVAIVVVFFAQQFFGSVVGISSHIFSTENSRADVWSRLWNEFVSHPIFGVGGDESGGESAYLVVLATYGLAGFVPFGIAIWLMLRDTVRVLRKRRHLGRHAVLVDVSMAMLAEALVASLFDAHLLASLAPQVFLVYICLSVYTLVLDPAVFSEHRQYELGQPTPSDSNPWSNQYIDGAFGDPVYHDSFGGFGDGSTPA